MSNNAKRRRKIVDWDSSRSWVRASQCLTRSAGLPSAWDRSCVPMLESEEQERWLFGIEEEEGAQIKSIL
jgi:hypothetical protein